MARAEEITPSKSILSIYVKQKSGIVLSSYTHVFKEQLCEQLVEAKEEHHSKSHRMPCWNFTSQCVTLSTQKVKLSSGI